MKRLKSSTSFSTLYHATDANGREVAVKIFGHNISEERYRATGLQSMHQRLAALNHPHILPVLESGQTDAGWYITENMPGGSLRDKLLRPMDPAQVAVVLDQVGQALDAAHVLGIVHGNLKPTNVLIDTEGRYRLADFGLGVLAAETPTIVHLFGTTPAPAYMSPEQASEMTMTPKSDVYSLGILAYQLLTSEVPYMGQDPVTIAGKQARGPADDPRDYNPKLSPEVSEVVLTALSRNPDRRYPTAKAFAQAFKEAVAKQDTSAVRLAAMTTRTAEPEPKISREGLPRLCWSCGHKNPPGTRRCENCWITLTTGDSGEGLEPLPAPAKYTERQRTLTIFSLSMVTALIVAVLLPIFDTGPTATTLISSAGAPGEWTTFQANELNTGFAAGPAPSLDGTVKWRLVMTQPVLAPPAVTKDAVYVATGDARMLALEPGTGATIWERRVTGPVNSAPTVAGGALFVAMRDGNIFAFNKDTGEELWRTQGGGSIYGGMKVKDGKLYVGTGSNDVLALDAATGRILWTNRTRGWITGVPAVTDNGFVVVGSSDGNLYSMDADTGKQTLRHYLTYGIDSSATVVGNTAYITLSNGSLNAIDYTARGRSWDAFAYYSRLQLFLWSIFVDQPPMWRGFQWRTVPGRSQSSSTAIAGSTAFFVTELVRGKSTGALHAIDINTHKELWSFPTTGSQTPTVVGDTVYVASSDGKVHGLDVADGSLRWEWQTPAGLKPSTPPIAAGDSLYLGMSGDSPALYVQRLDNEGQLLADQDTETPDSWYYKFGPTYCAPEESAPAGPFPTQRDALTSGYNATPYCGAFYAIQ